MLKSLLLTVMAAALAASMGYASQSDSKVIIPVGKASPTSGQEMYANYCATFHGVDGKGHGPVAGTLKTPPSDLTVLSKNNHGKFPGEHVLSILQFGVEVPTHGSALMPVWGPILGKMNTSNPDVKQLRMVNLSRYLESIQVK